MLSKKKNKEGLFYNITATAMKISNTLQVYSSALLSKKQKIFGLREHV